MPAGVQVGELDDPGAAPSLGKTGDRSRHPLTAQHARAEQGPIEREREWGDGERHRHRRGAEVRNRPSGAEDRVEEAAHHHAVQGICRDAAMNRGRRAFFLRRRTSASMGRLSASNTPGTEKPSAS